MGKDCHPSGAPGRRLENLLEAPPGGPGRSLGGPWQGPGTSLCSTKNSLQNRLQMLPAHSKRVITLQGSLEGPLGGPGRPLGDLLGGPVEGPGTPLARTSASPNPCKPPADSTRRLQDTAGGLGGGVGSEQSGKKTIARDARHSRIRREKNLHFGAILEANPASGLWGG